MARIAKTKRVETPVTPAEEVVISVSTEETPVEEKTEEIQSEYVPSIDEEQVSSIDVPDINIVVPESSYVAPVKEYNDAKKIRVRLSVNHRCFIGGEWYFFTKGEAYNVPENVKRILSEANLLAPL